MLELWRSPAGSGDPVGCLTSTFTFNPGLFDEQCLARFLEIDSQPDREDLAFLLERETRLGSVYAGVLVDHTQAGVSHSLRWDVLPVRVPRGKQHAKVSLLAWTHRVRIIVTSANLTEPGYRQNFEVAGHIDGTPECADGNLIRECCGFLRVLLDLVPCVPGDGSGISRAATFIEAVERHVRDWRPASRSQSSRQYLAFTHPETASVAASSSLETALSRCRSAGGAPSEAWMASPFFDPSDADRDRNTAMIALGKSMARGVRRTIYLCLPVIKSVNAEHHRLAAPRSLLSSAQRYVDDVTVKALPAQEKENTRPWHAKMLRLASDAYTALLIGSSNFTTAGLGLGNARNTEANLLYLAPRRQHAREPGRLDKLWPDMETIEEPEEAEWLDPLSELVEEEAAVPAQGVPWGFISATYHAGDQRFMRFRFEAGGLPEHWAIMAVGRHAGELVNSDDYRKQASPVILDVDWLPVEPPDVLVVRWGDDEARWPLNIADPRKLPPPDCLEKMSADEMLMILAASDPGAALRAWARRHQVAELPDELDAAEPPDLDPLRAYPLQETFLRRIRLRARVLAAARANLQRPAWSRQAIDWRLRGLLGIETLAQRMVQELAASNGNTSEAVLGLADLLVMLSEVTYEEAVGAVPNEEFGAIYRPFLADLSRTLDQNVRNATNGLAGDVRSFWKEVLSRCQEQ